VDLKENVCYKSGRGTRKDLIEDTPQPHRSYQGIRTNVLRGKELGATSDHDKWWIEAVPICYYNAILIFGSLLYTSELSLLIPPS
jgi:hypothetical protein